MTEWESVYSTCNKDSLQTMLKNKLNRNNNKYEGNENQSKKNKDGGFTWVLHAFLKCQSD